MNTSWKFVLLFLSPGIAGCGEHEEPTSDMVDPSDRVLQSVEETSPEDCVSGRACNPETFTRVCQSINKADCRSIYDDPVDDIGDIRCSCRQGFHGDYSLTCMSTCNPN